MSSKVAIPGAKRGTIFMVEPETLFIVGLDTDDDDNHPLYDERIKLPLDEGFIQNIRKHGVLENVLVRKNGDTLEVVAGRQRVRAAREATKRNAEDGLPPVLVPVTVKKTKNDAEGLTLLISENENRRDDDAITRAHKAQRLANYGYTEDDIAVEFGISAQSVRNLLMLLDLSPKVQRAVSARKIGYTAALTLRDLKRAEQEAKLDELVKAGASFAEAKRQEQIRKAEKSGKKVPKPHQSTRGRAVKAPVLRKIAGNDDFIQKLSPDAQNLLAWILGDEAAAQRIDGLSDLLS